MDLLTLTIVNQFIAGTASALLLLLFLADTRQQHLLYWTVAACCMFVSSTLATLFYLGQPLPYWLAPALSNNLTLGIHLALLAGLYRYFQHHVRLYWFFAAALVMFCLHFTDFAQQATANRLLLNFPVMIWINVLSLRLLFGQRDPALSSVYLAFKLAFIFNIMQLGLRFMLVLSEQTKLSLISGSNLLHSLGFFGLTTFAILVFGSGILLVYRRQQLALQSSSERDPLTGVLNRSSMEQKITTELDRCQRQGSYFSLVIFDIDHFKQVNDQYGHLAGDAALRHIAAVTSAQLRSYDLLFRYGGEEFVVCLPDTDSNVANQIASRIRKAIEGAVLANYPDLNLTISAGLASSNPTVNWQQLLTRADQALYQAKHNGRNQIRQYSALEPQTI